MGGGPPCLVQFPTQCLPDQERRLPLCLTTLHVNRKYDYDAVEAVAGMAWYTFYPYMTQLVRITKRPGTWRLPRALLQIESKCWRHDNPKKVGKRARVDFYFLKKNLPTVFNRRPLGK